MSPSLSVDRRNFLKTTALSGLSTLFSSEAVADRKAEKKHLLTARVYDAEYKPIPEAATSIAKELLPLSLEETINQVYDPKDPSTYAFTNILGVTPTNGRAGKLDFKQGLEYAWDIKLSKVSARLTSQREILKGLRDTWRNYLDNSRKSSMRSFRREEIAKALSNLSSVHAQKMYTEHKQRFLDTMVKLLSPNVLLSYHVQELTPPAYWDKDKNYSLQLNPVVKIDYLDKIFKEGGKVVIMAYPAMHDPVISFGPFQLTNYAWSDAKRYNSYSPRKLPDKLQDTETLQQHADAAALFAYFNWALVANALAHNHVLKDVNKEFERLAQDKDSLDHLRIFVAGSTACLHHQPAHTRRDIVNFMKGVASLDNVHYEFRRKGLVTPQGQQDLQLVKYYDSCAEAYLLLKIWHTLDEKYGGG